MSTGEQELDTAEGTETEAPEAEPKRKLALDVNIQDVGPCKKHLKVAIPREDIEHQFEESLGEVRKGAAVPGFRPGRAPKVLVQKRYRKEVAGQVKSSLLMACMEQLDEDYKLNPITQPRLDLEAIELPDDGPMTFEMDLEVQPDFDVPAYKALHVKRPVKTISEDDVENQKTLFLERYAQMVPKLEGGAELGDYVTADLAFHKGGVQLNTSKEVQLRVQPELRFQDGKIANLSDVLLGAKPGDVRDATAQMGTNVGDPALRGQEIEVTIHVNDLKRLRMPDVTPAFLQGIGFESLEDLREALREVLERRLKFQQRQAIRTEIMDQLCDQTPFDLPSDLVRRQEQTTLRRRVDEMRQAGLGEPQIRAREAEIRAYAHEQTLRSLKEFFILSRIAEAEGLKVEDEDFEAEIESIADRTDETPRRIRARIEKEGLAEGLASQILERKTIDRILEYVAFEDVPMVEETAVETIDQVVSPPSEEEEPGEESAESSTGHAAEESKD